MLSMPAGDQPLALIKQEVEEASAAIIVWVKCKAILGAGDDENSC